MRWHIADLHAFAAACTALRVRSDGVALRWLPTGKKCILVDDMCDTGGTLVKAAQQLKDAGATEERTYALLTVLSTHSLVSSPQC